MSATTLTPPPAVVPVGFPPRPYRWTVAEFHRLGDIGVFEGRRPFLIAGVLYEQGPMNPPHAMALSLAEAALRAAFGSGWYLRVQQPLVLGLGTDPLPDIAIVPGGPRDYSTHPATAVLVVEVSDTSLQTDETTKAELYATAGVPDYWVLDVNGRVLHVFRDPAPLTAGLGATAYRTHLTLGPTDTVSPLAAPHAAVRVADLLP